MAAINISRVTFVSNDPIYGVFVAGDVVDTYWDPTTLSLSVKKNGSDYSSSGASSIDVLDLNSQYMDQSYRVVTLLQPYYCVSTTQYSFSFSRAGNGYIFGGAATEWPYIFVTETPGSNLCAVTPVVPDLAWSGTPTIIHATNASSQDGSITYAATSTYGPVFYSLTLFVQGIFQYSSTQTGLAPGNYILTAKDQKGFSITYSFSIVDLSLGLPQPPLVIPDIQFPGTPTITTDTGAGNGSITFTATSSYSPIQYALRDFVYGQGQASSTFNNIIAGNYILYAVDSKNCKATYQFTVPLNGVPSTPPASAPVQQIIYQMQVTDYNGKLNVLNILKKQYSSYPTQVDGGNDDPIVYTTRLEASTDKYACIIPSQIMVCLKSATSYQFQELISADAETYRVQWYQDGLLKLVAKIYPQSYQEPYNESINYPVSFICTDGLQELDNVDFVDDSGTRFFGVQKSIVVIAMALAKLRFNLNIRVACNIYATGMTSAATDDPLDQAWVDMQAYYTETDALSCQEVIKRILEPYCASICQYGGYWYIVRFEELVASSVDYREFDINGAYVSNSSMSPIINIKKNTDASRLVWSEAGTTQDLISPQGNIEVTYKQGLKKTLIRNGTFDIVNQVTPFQTTKQTIDISGFSIANNGDTTVATSIGSVDGSKTNGALIFTGSGLAYLLAKVTSLKMLGNDKLTVGLKYKTDDFTSALFRYQKIKMRVQHGSYYLQSDGSWSTTASDLVNYEKDFGKFKSFTVIAGQANSSLYSGADLTIWVYSSYAFDAEFTSLVTMRTKVTVGLPTGYRTEYKTGTTLYYYELENNTSAESVPDIIRPNDYNAGTNPYQWIRKQTAFQYAGMPGYGNTYFDELIVKYQPGGTELVEDSIESLSPQNNKAFLKKTLYHGSAVGSVVSIFNFGINLSLFGATGELTGTAVGNANPTKVYTNFLRKSDGTAWTTWKRDAVAEAENLQTIFLKSYAAQYRLPSSRLSGALSSMQINNSIAPVYLTPINMLKDNYNGKFYRPMGYSYHVRQCLYEGEFLEIVDITSGGTSTTGGMSTFNSSFNSSHGS